MVLSADFQLTPTPVEELRAVMRANLEWRDDRHPDLWLYPSAGSIFQKTVVPMMNASGQRLIHAPAGARRQSSMMPRASGARGPWSRNSTRVQRSWRAVAGCRS